MRNRNSTTSPTAIRSISTLHCFRRIGVAAACALAIVTTLPACGVGSAPRGDLAGNRKILAACDASAPQASDIHIDGSGSSASKTITEERMIAIKEIVRTTAICAGRLRVQVFAGSSAATTTLFDKPLVLHGATDVARLKRVPKLVEEVMVKIREAHELAVADLPGGGSDITGQYRLAREWIDQVGGDNQLHLYLLTDGMQTVGVDLYKKVLTKQEATDLANHMTVPKLPGASVTVAGLGRVAGSPPPSKVVEGLTSFYDALCAETDATTCHSVTTYSAEGPVGS